jgi:hypothetical protein
MCPAAGLSGPPDGGRGPGTGPNVAVAPGRLLLVVETLSTSPPGQYVLTAVLLVGRADGSVKTLFTAPQQVGLMITAGRRWAAETRNHKIKK